jgi:hypothetical protein
MVIHKQPLVRLWKVTRFENQDTIMVKNVEGVALFFKVLFYYLPGRDLKFFAGKAPTTLRRHATPIGMRYITLFELHNLSRRQLAANCH